MLTSTTTQARTFAATALAQLNSLSKYPSILTLHALGERGRLTPTLTTPALFDQPLSATEKIDGTNARILVFADGSYLVGSRENLLTASGDLLFDPGVGIVNGLRRLIFPTFANAHGLLPALAYATDSATPAPLTVVYGEFYGGKVTAGSKNYALPEQVGFRVFDVVVFSDEMALASQLTADVREIAAWRETETLAGLRYGQSFLPASELSTYLARVGLPGVPQLPPFDVTAAEVSHEYVLNWLRQHILHTQVSLPGLPVPGRAEGAILRTADRLGIVKIRFEDYERTLNQRGKA